MERGSERGSESGSESGLGVDRESCTGQNVESLCAGQKVESLCGGQKMEGERQWIGTGVMKLLPINIDFSLNQTHI